MDMSLLLLLHSITMWEDYFTVTNPTKFNSQRFSLRQNPSNSYVYVSNCLFISIASTSGNGGALCCTSVTYFLVESTSFFSCSTSGGYGGAIYFANGNGQSVLYEVCGYNCYTTYTNPYYQFAEIQINNFVSSKNFGNYSSISCCVNVNSNPWHVLHFCYGNICCPSVNVSLNKCYGQLIYYYPSVDSNSVTCSISYSSFANNSATQWTCILLWRNSAKYEIKSCNILRNSQGTSSEGTITTYGNLMIRDSCILENKANCIFYSYSSYAVTLSNCTVDSSSNNGYLTTQNTVTKSFILALNHMSTLNCKSEYDSVGTLSPVIQTPSSSKKQRLCYTFGKFFSQSPLRDFFLLTSVSLIIKLLLQ
jgi:hypothetical protein